FQSFTGSAIFNLLAFAPPAVAKLSSSEVVITNIYTYIGIIVEVMNDGIPRSAWLIIGDKSSRSLHSRLNLAWTMIILTAIFVPAEVRHASLAYIRWSSIQGLTSATEAAISSSTRALDKPDIPLIISASKFLINIVLDFLLVSTFRVGKFTPTIVTQAIIRLTCDILSVMVGLLYFVCVVVKRKKREADGHGNLKISLDALKTLVRPSLYTFGKIVQLGDLYATAWGNFTTIRWGLIMVPVQALEASTLAFVRYNWGYFRATQQIEYPKATRAEVFAIIRPALLSCGIVMVFETTVCIALSIHGIQSFALYLSALNDVTAVTQRIWKAIDWTYIFYGLNYQLGAVLLVASLGGIYTKHSAQTYAGCFLGPSFSLAWTYYVVIFGDALVFDLLGVGVTLLIWIYRLSRGKLRARSHIEYH
ncbi:uncharacterized protein N7483_002020, partial [Penicillium malachiteum]|uniref:uncharacterized protein n=1 Tax=Penicillium malachiteum TaxID=1324776 RepID=UPI0025468014